MKSVDTNREVQRNRVCDESHEKALGLETPVKAGGGSECDMAGKRVNWPLSEGMVWVVT